VTRSGVSEGRVEGYVPRADKGGAYFTRSLLRPDTGRGRCSGGHGGCGVCVSDGRWG
jgi:hypothetical protein